jgi:rod shape-determining protein MreB
LSTSEFSFCGVLLDIGIDLGTVNVLIYQRGRSIVLRELSVVAVNKSPEKHKVLAISPAF